MSIIVDISELSKEGHHCEKRVFRLVISISMIVFTAFLQIYLVTKVKMLVCDQSVHRIRDLYSEYEEHMYQETYTDKSGHSRGVIGTWRGQEAFDDLDDDTKTELCQFPLSQPDFTGATLLIWSLSCLSEIRKCLNWMYRFLWKMETSSLARMYEPDEDGGGVVNGLHFVVKGCIFVLLTTQIGTAMYLLWVGCRWLVATPSFSELILNGLALTFIVELKEMLYHDMMPRMFHIQTERLKVRRGSIMMDNKTLATPVVLFFVCLAWVGAYMVFLQQVLPDYKWDARATCHDFLTNDLISV